jgi:hypothetical protein
MDPVTLEYQGSFVWTVSNGDQLFGNFQGQFVPTAEAGIFVNKEAFQITDGTGRLNAATGGGMGNPFQPNFYIPFAGTIRSPGSNKR